MPRVLKVGVCRVCSVEYVLRDRRYKLTCSPECALDRGILNQLASARLQGVTIEKIKSKLAYYIGVIMDLPPL